MTKVSVIIPTRNRPEKLKRAVRSVLDQGIKQIEIIIIDDASDSGHQPVIDQIATSSTQIRLFKQEKSGGAAQARNLGIEKSIGEYLLFLDDDDELLPDMLNNSMSYLEAGAYDCTTCNCKIIGEHLSASKLKRYGKAARRKFPAYSLESNPEAYIFLHHPQIHTFLVSRKAIGGIRFESGQPYGEDLWFWMQLARKKLRFGKLDFTGCIYHLHQSSTSYFVNYDQKLNYYRESLRRFGDNRLIRNLCWIKMAAVGFRKDDPRTFIWLMKSMTQPILFVRHARYYLGLIF